MATYFLASITFDDSLAETVDLRQLPKDWRAEPPKQAAKDLGDEWVIQQRSVVLKVPSVIIETEFNYLLNPEHPAIARCLRSKPIPFRFDPRLAMD